MERFDFIQNNDDNIPLLLKSKLGLKFEGNIFEITEKIVEILMRINYEDKMVQISNEKKNEKGFCIRCGKHIV